MEKTLTLFNSDNFKKIAFAYTKDDKVSLIIASTKQNLQVEELEAVAEFLAEYEIIKAEFGVFNMYVTEKQLDLYNNMTGKNAK